MLEEAIREACETSNRQMKEKMPQEILLSGATCAILLLDKT